MDPAKNTTNETNEGVDISNKNYGIEERNHDDQADEEESGLITLNACGDIVTKWQFPRNKTDCPVRRCQESFITRTDAINHYKIRHSMNAIACYICDRPISVHSKLHYIEHFERLHNDVLDPFDFNTQKSHSKISTDLITLNGCGYKTQWQMPSNQTGCPVYGCRYQSFESRFALITHYKKMHSKMSIYCCICDKPVVSPCRREFINHYKRMHANVLDPFDFEANEKLPKMRLRKKVMSIFIFLFIQSVLVY